MLYTSKISQGTLPIMKTITILWVSFCFSLYTLAQPYEPVPIEKYFVSAEKGEHLPVNKIREKYPQLSQMITNGFTSYKIIYHSHNVNGELIDLSGALFIPDSDELHPLLNYNHGTIFPSQERNAPSYLSNFSMESGIGKIFSAAGYVVMLPDYIGYGSSKSFEHPYGAYDIIARSSIDMIYAVKEFCKKEKIRLSSKNFFSGWSEGAAVAMAVIRQLEKSGDIQPTATVLNAGPYFSSGFVQHILNSQEPLKFMNTYAWVLQSYNRVYQLHKPLEYFFNAEAAAKLKLNIQAKIPLVPDQLFNETFKASYLSGNEKDLEEIFIRNDLWNWKPAGKLVLCHGDQDDYVPYFNSVKAYEEMKVKGADVSLRTFKGQTHSSGVMYYLMEMYQTFKEAN